jgi:hypothetical protein
MSRATTTALVGLVFLGVAGCSPSVKIEAPDKPIVINLNVKIEQEVRIRVEKDLESLFESKEKIF